MLVKAKVSFSGKISMAAGDVQDIKDKYILNDLLKAGYIEPEAQEAEIVKEPAKKSYIPEEKVGNYIKATIGIKEDVEKPVEKKTVSYKFVENSKAKKTRKKSK